MQAWTRVGLCGLSLLAFGCTALLGGEDAALLSDEEDGNLSDRPAEENPDVAPTEFSCDEALQKPSPGMRRLTKRQYENTLVDLLSARLGERAPALEVLSELESRLALIPEDERAVVPEDLHGSFRRLDQSVQQSHVDGWYEVGVAAGEILSRPEHLGVLVGSCGTDDDAENDAQCVRDFVRNFGDLALRRPLTDEEVSFYEGFYAPSTGIDPAGFADVVAGLLNAPEFLYVVEHGDGAAEGQENTFELGAYELASRLSYHFWGTMPDARLFELAESGALLEESTYLTEVERLWDDDRTRLTLREFFLEWMKLEEVPSLDQNNGAAVFQSFAGDDLPSPTLRDAMIDEVLDLFDYYTWNQPGGIEQLFLTPHSFARSAELASFYGVQAWNGEGEPPIIQGERPGVLTRAAFLATGTASTRPVMKGLFIRRHVLCDVIPPPPDNVMANPPDLSPNLSTRQVVEALTEEEGTSCSNCHRVYMNPLGFTTEGFDSLGRERRAQRLFDDEGSFLGEAEIDTSSIPQVILGDMTPSNGPTDLMGLIADSGKPGACAARQYFRFSFGRWEGVVSDGCALEQMRLALEETGSLAGMLRSVAFTKAFHRRTFNFDAATVGEN